MDVSSLKGSVENQQRLFYIYSSVFLFQILIKRAKANKDRLHTTDHRFLFFLNLFSGFFSLFLIVFFSGRKELYITFSSFFFASYSSAVPCDPLERTNDT